MARIYKYFINYYQNLRDMKFRKIITHSSPCGCHKSACPVDICGGPSYRKTPRKL